MTLHLSPVEIEAAFADVFDHSLVFHGYADFMRDYDVVVCVTADPRSGIPTEFLRYRFRHCVRASVTTALPPEVWADSLDDRLTNLETGVDLAGYVWGVRSQILYPGISLVRDSREAIDWSSRIRLPMHQATIRTNGNNVNLIFSGLEVTTLAPGWSPFQADAD